ncbi:hypothetical protein FQZ97_787010 [compost metagenome]
MKRKAGLRDQEAVCISRNGLIIDKPLVIERSVSPGVDPESGSGILTHGGILRLRQEGGSRKHCYSKGC